MLRGSSAEITITPPVGVNLLGTLTPSTGVHDDLYGRVILLDDGAKSVAIICLDLIGLNFAKSDKLRQVIKHKHSIDNVLINCSHTHSAPFTIPWSVTGWQASLDNAEEQKWFNSLESKLLELVKKAKSKLEPVTLRNGRADVQVGINRRVIDGDGNVGMAANLEGASTDWVDVLVMKDESQSIIGTLFSHAAHPVIVHATSDLISADFPGEAVGCIKDALGPDVVTMFAQGCCGNVNGEPLRAGHDAAAEAGKRLGEAVLKAIEGSKVIESEDFRFDKVSTDLDLQALPTEKDCRKKIAGLEKQIATIEDKGETLWMLDNQRLGLIVLLEKIAEGKKGKLRLDVNSIKFGKALQILALSHEPFAEYAIWANENGDCEQTMVLGYTNGCESYLPTDKGLMEGGYEGAGAPELGAALSYSSRLAIAVGQEEKVKKAMAECGKK